MIILYALGFLNTFVLTLLSWIFFFVPHYLKGTFERVYITKELAIIWDVANDSKFYKESMDGWYGFVLGANVCVVDVPSKENDWWKKHFKHEVKGHVIQYFIFSLLFFVFYILFTLFILAFLKNKHSYHDNPFEIWARKVAGQQLHIPREEWMDGPNDRFPWN